MVKYIDAEKLMTLIDTKLEDLGMSGSVWVGRSVLRELKDEIMNILQQEQSESYGLTKTDTLERVHGWVTRDKYNDPFVGTGLIFHHTKPTRCNGEWSSSTIAMHLSYDMFPDLKWEDDPIEVDLLIVKKNNND